jgi:hypothetical protein
MVRNRPGAAACRNAPCGSELARETVAPFARLFHSANADRAQARSHKTAGPHVAANRSPILSSVL